MLYGNVAATLHRHCAAIMQPCNTARLLQRSCNVAAKCAVRVVLNVGAAGTSNANSVDNRANQLLFSLQLRGGTYRVSYKYNSSFHEFGLY